MIRTFRCQETRAIHEGYSSRRFGGIEEQARKRLRWLDAATSLADLGAIRGNRLEALKSDRAGQANIAFGLTTAGVSAFLGARGARTMSRSWIVTEKGEELWRREGNYRPSTQGFEASVGLAAIVDFGDNHGIGLFKTEKDAPLADAQAIPAFQGAL